MNIKLIAAALIAASTAIAVPAFASGSGSGGGGVGPAGPVGYSWLNTAQGQSVQRDAAERQGDRNANTAYGGSNNNTSSQSGMRASAGQSDNESN